MATTVFLLSRFTSNNLYHIPSISKWLVSTTGARLEHHFGILLLDGQPFFPRLGALTQARDRKNLWPLAEYLNSPPFRLATSPVKYKPLTEYLDLTASGAQVNRRRRGYDGPSTKMMTPGDIWVPRGRPHNTQSGFCSNRYSGFIKMGAETR